MLSDCFDGRLGVITGVRIEKNSIGFLGFYFILLTMVVLGPTHFFLFNGVWIFRCFLELSLEFC